MRDILNFPQIDHQKLDAVKQLIDSIAENQNGDNSHALNELSRLTGKKHEASDFAEYWGWTDLEDLAKMALTPDPPRVADLTKEEITELVSVIRSCLISCEDNKAEYYIELLHRSLSLPNVMNYIMSGEDEAAIVNNIINAAANSVIAL